MAPLGSKKVTKTMCVGLVRLLVVARVVGERCRANPTWSCSTWSSSPFTSITSIRAHTVQLEAWKVPNTTLKWSGQNWSTRSRKGDPTTHTHQPPPTTARCVHCPQPRQGVHTTAPHPAPPTWRAGVKHRSCTLVVHVRTAPPTRHARHVLPSLSYPTHPHVESRRTSDGAHVHSTTPLTSSTTL